MQGRTVFARGYIIGGHIMTVKTVNRFVRKQLVQRHHNHERIDIKGKNPNAAAGSSVK
jgi:hypothetical protein